MSSRSRERNRRSNRARRRGKGKQPKKHVTGVTSEEQLRAILDFWDYYLKRAEAIHIGIHRRFRDFRKGAVEDLQNLTEKGVHPGIVISTIFQGLLYNDAPSAAQTEDELTYLSSPRYWERGRRELLGANGFLSDLTSVGCVRFTRINRGEGSEFVNLARQAFEASAKIKDLLQTIERLGLAEPGWRLESCPGTPEIRKTKVVGRKRSGKRKDYSYSLCAAELHEYFRRTTGRPRWATIARLLHFAGFREFPKAIPPDGAKTGREDVARAERWEYTNKLRWRVKQLMKDPYAASRVRAWVDWHCN